MISVSSAFLDAMYNKDIRSFIYNINVELANGSKLSLKNEDIYNGGVSIEESVSDDSQLQLGSAIINKCTVVLINFDDRWASYNFQDARITVYIGLKVNESDFAIRQLESSEIRQTQDGYVRTINGSTAEFFKRGTYIVTEQDFNNSLLTLTCLDDMSLFEQPYKDSTLAYPATLLQIVQDACTACRVTMGMEDFPNCNFTIDTKPTMQGTTYRDVISWVAQVAGCFARIDNDGYLQIQFYDFPFLQSVTEEMLADWTGELELTTEDEVVLMTENSQDIILDSGGFDVFRGLYSINTAYNDTTVTGVRVCVDNPNATGADDALLEYTSGTDSYEILIENNLLITPDNAQAIADYVGSKLIGATYRKANFTHLSDPVTTAGNVAIIWDSHGNSYRVIVSSTTFTAGDRQNTVSAGSTPPRIPNQPVQLRKSTRGLKAAPVLRASTPTGTSVRRYTEQTKQFIRMAKNISSFGGLYYTAVESSGGGTVHYLHNKPSLEESNIQIVISTDGIMVTANALDDEPDWYGMKVDGEFLAEVLETAVIRSQNGRLVINLNTGRLTSTSGDDWLRIFESRIDGGYENTTDGTLDLSAQYVAQNQRNVVLRAVTDDIIINADNGDVLIGSNANKKVYRNGLPIVASNKATGADDTEYIKDIYHTSTSSTHFIGFGNYAGTIYFATVTTSSDERLKYGIQDVDVSALDIINAIEHKQFNFIEGNDHRNCGYIAQQLQKVIPEAVVPVPQSNADGNKTDDILNIVDHEVLTYATKAIQELSAKVDALTNRVSELEQKLAERGE